LKIEETLTSRVFGQERAIEKVCKTLKNAFSGIRDPNKPIGSFVFGGQTGTGKTYLAKELAMAVFGKESSLIRLDMSEFSEPHSVSKLIGSPPGYVGFEEVDNFIDKIRRKPYCIVLMDELEKAHPDVIKLFLQVMSDGVMTDASGNKADLKNIILIMTGNFGMNENAKGSLGFSESKSSLDSKKVVQFKAEQQRLIKYCQENYGHEFVNRVDEFVPFMSLSDEDMKKIIKIHFDEISGRMVCRKCGLEFTDATYASIVKESRQEHGKNASSLNRIMVKEIEPVISDALLSIKEKDRFIIVIDRDEIKENFIYHVKKASK